MKVPQKLAFLAIADSMQVLNAAGDPLRVTWRKNEAGVFVNGSLKVLFVLPLSNKRRVEVPRGAFAQKNAFELFTDWQTDTAFELSLPDNRSKLGVFGYAVDIRYESDKWTGRKTLYVHDFKTAVSVYSDRENPKQIRAWGMRADNKRRIISERGIIQ